MKKEMKKPEKKEMKKKDLKDPVDEFMKLKNEILSEKIEEVFKTNSENYREELSKIGFEWSDDDYPDEIEEENSAVAQNQNQERLLAYFHGEIAFSDTLLDIFLTEKNAAEPNYPLFRKYFRQGNSNLKALIYRGLEKDPTDTGFLSDLAFLHEFHPMLKELIALYSRACELAEDSETFLELAEDFHLNTFPDGYDAYHALKEAYGPDTTKGMIIEHLIQAEREMDEDIMF
ncbi:MAG: hypothetical protein U5R49_17975 [Deltaproteobacteria bacterium]|nr:hypothetical protein [Deltaproteobacteria bacterium]